MSPLVVDLAPIVGVVTRAAPAADRRPNRCAVIPKNFSAVGPETLASRFGGPFGRIFSTALNRFSITLSEFAARASPP
ncbi:hypothetical protein IOD16_08365 [Saccharothrix sp. 6-C]|uniref:hypothetical protein n=1 Tax=Saccharothrix sp. 6-C TaxID=2781735 RepID=UPI001916E3BB|nr:hypothetical protein [Saccharothrix sp. 6-C]QQQ78459.1 hypothetical protein IOD16_08365 [Saccharothrix sp. 6-C]